MQSAHEPATPNGSLTIGPNTAVFAYCLAMDINVGRVPRAELMQVNC